MYGILSLLQSCFIHVVSFVIAVGFTVSPRGTPCSLRSPARKPAMTPFYVCLVLQIFAASNRGMEWNGVEVGNVGNVGNGFQGREIIKPPRKSDGICRASCQTQLVFSHDLLGYFNWNCHHITVLHSLHCAKLELCWCMLHQETLSRYLRVMRPKFEAYVMLQNPFPRSFTSMIHHPSWYSHRNSGSVRNHQHTMWLDSRFIDHAVLHSSPMLESRDKKIPRRFREDSEKIWRCWEFRQGPLWIRRGSPRRQLRNVVAVPGAPSPGTPVWHRVALGRHMDGTWEARGSWCFNVFHGLSWSSACWNNCLQLFTWRYPSHFVNCSSCRNAVCFGTPTNSFKAVQHPVQAVILKDLAGMKVYSSAACQGFTNFFQLSHY